MNHSEPAEQNADQKTELKSPGAASRAFTQAAPFLLPLLFFQSAVFTLIAPLPLFLLTLRAPIWMSALALAFNTALLYAIGTPNEAGVAFFFWLSVGVLFPYLFRRSGRLKLSLGLSFVYLMTVLVAALAFLAQKSGMNLIEYVRADLSMDLDHLMALPQSSVKDLVEEQGRDVFFKNLMVSLPAFVLIGTLVSFWINLLFASQISKNLLPANFWETYRNPEWLVYPTLAFGALVAFSDHAPYYIGLNGFKFMLLLYGFQGLSVLSYLLSRYKIYGFGRALLFCFSIFVAMPLVLSLGFFDLWFDFRRKFGQS